LVPVFHPGPCDVGVHYRSATESELYVRRGERWLLERSSDLWRGDGLSDRRLVRASPFTIKHARLVHRAGQTLIGPMMAAAEWGDPGTQYTEQDISPYFWLNGTL